MNSNLEFKWTNNPFTFSVSRRNGEVLFNTSGHPMIFESQYLGLRTQLPPDPYLYGLGEHTDPFRLNTTNYTRTLWSRDAYGIPGGTNLYGNHPVYLDHRGSNGTHAVLLLNSNGMDIKINNTAGQYLEYNTLGGVLDFYFVAGPGPSEAASQISEIVGKPAMMPYWGFGFHQCRYGYRDVYEVAEVVYNYSQASIPLETMWTDIDYMDARKIMTVDPQRFPLPKMRELVNHLHNDQQHYIVMVDPAVAYQDYAAFNNGKNMSVYLHNEDGSIYQGVVWAGVSAFPDWFHPDTQDWWNNEFATFFSTDTGIDIDALWIDMNEPSNFCNYPCNNASGFAIDNNYPPMPPAVRAGPAISLPGWPSNFQPPNTKRQSMTGQKKGLPNRSLITPPYTIANAAGSLSNKTANTNLIQSTGLTQYDTHNMYGHMMSTASRGALLHRRPHVRPMVITRSTYLGAGTSVGHWTGDNAATWSDYLISISDMLNFNAIFQIPLVGSDVCGYGMNTTSTLCARWMMLGAFYPFYRNHNELGNIGQEAYRWPMVAEASRYAIDIRYRLLDYFYTQFEAQSKNGVPSLWPLWFAYPDDEKTFTLQNQFLFGGGVMVSPVTQENATHVQIYVPKDKFYDWNDGFMPVMGKGSMVNLTDVGFSTIPLHVKSGTIIPARLRSANTTTELRKEPFQLIVATGMDGSATGSLYLDEGNMLVQPHTSQINFTYAENMLKMTGTYGYDAGVGIESVLVLGVDTKPMNVSMGKMTYNATSKVANITVSIPLTGNANLTLHV